MHVSASQSKIDVNSHHLLPKRSSSCTSKFQTFRGSRHLTGRWSKGKGLRTKGRLRDYLLHPGKLPIKMHF